MITNPASSPSLGENIAPTLHPVSSIVSVSAISCGSCADWRCGWHTRKGTWAGSRNNPSISLSWVPKLCKYLSGHGNLTTKNFGEARSTISRRPFKRHQYEYCVTSGPCMKIDKFSSCGISAPISRIMLRKVQSFQGAGNPPWP